jgi:hypothetical protein
MFGDFCNSRKVRLLSITVLTTDQEIIVEYPQRKLGDVSNPTYIRLVSFRKYPQRKLGDVSNPTYIRLVSFRKYPQRKLGDLFRYYLLPALWLRPMDRLDGRDAGIARQDYNRLRLLSEPLLG